MTYRSELDALTARHDALVLEVERKQRELDTAGRLLAEAKAKVHLPVLDNIRVASPCSANWSTMTGDERTRHCSDCNKNVYNLSNMTREEAETLIVATEGELCVRYYQRKDGTILLRDCTVGARRKRRRRLIVAGAAAALAGGAMFALADDDAHEEQVMGGIGYHIPPQGEAHVSISAEAPDDAFMGQVVVMPPDGGEQLVEEVKGGIAHGDEIEVRMGTK